MYNNDDNDQKQNNEFDLEINSNDSVDFGVEEDEEQDDSVVVSRSKLALIQKMAKNVKECNDQLLDLLSSVVSSEDLNRITIGQIADDNFNEKESFETEGQIIEGVFDGENMIGPDGKKYSMPSNYASKSKLVEGDIMKLTIADNGTFVYKQIGPIERKRVVGLLDRNIDGEYIVEDDGKQWRVLNASVTYFKGQSGDEVVLLVPKIGESKWGAVENIIRKV